MKQLPYKYQIVGEQLALKNCKHCHGTGSPGVAVENIERVKTQDGWKTIGTRRKLLCKCLVGGSL